MGLGRGLRVRLHIGILWSRVFTWGGGVLKVT